MKHTLGFIYAVICYFVGLGGLLLLIAYTSNLIPGLSIDAQAANVDPFAAILINIGLVTLLGIQHSVMARQSFKNWLYSFIPKHLERSTYVAISGLVVALMVWQWAPIDGIVWSVPNDSVAYYILFALFFVGWGILLLSSFLINHFDLFGLRQAYLKMVGVPYTKLNFKVYSLYKLVRHPIYLGIVLGVWATPTMTITHLLMAVLLTIYVLIGIYYEEKDLIKEFGRTYLNYKSRVPKLNPLFKFFKSKSINEIPNPTLES